MNMNALDIEIDFLSDDDLDAVTGGLTNLSNPVVEKCLASFMEAAPKAGADYFVNQVQICAP
jgi:hypothetical protein